MTSVGRGSRFERRTLQRESQTHQQRFSSHSFPLKQREQTEGSLLPTRFTFGGPLNSWIFSSMSLIQPCISSGESVC